MIACCEITRTGFGGKVRPIKSAGQENPVHNSFTFAEGVVIIILQMNVVS